MYIVDGTDRRDIVIPVVEIVYPRSQPLNKLPDGTEVSIHPGTNRHKKGQDSPFQLVMNLVQSLWELAIISLGLYRVYQFYGVEQLQFLSVAPICCLLEVIAASLRLAYTCVDPFFTYRMLSNPVSLVLITLSIPFSESGGILITFFCTFLFIYTNSAAKASVLFSWRKKQIETSFLRLAMNPLLLF